MVDFEILSYNTRGIGDEAKRKKIFNYTERNSSGKPIIFLQETHSTKQVENLWRHQWHGDMIFSHGTSNSKGCCIAFRYDLEYKLLSPEISDENGRFIILHIEIQVTPYILINYYGPNSESAQVKVLERIASYLYDMEIDDSVHFVLGGDWNLIFDKTLDFMGGSPSLKYSSLKRLQSIMIDFNLVDIWRVRNPSFRQFTWHRSNPPKMSQIDFSLISNEMQYNVKFCKHLPSFLSDHSPVILRVSSLADSESRGRGYWKFNNSLTNDNKFVETLKNNIREWKSMFDSQQDPRVKWEFLKYKIFRFSKIMRTSWQKREKGNGSP